MYEVVLSGGGDVHPPPKPDRWINLVDLTQYMWQHGEILADLVWTILILIPKGNKYPTPGGWLARDPLEGGGGYH